MTTPRYRTASVGTSGVPMRARRHRPDRKVDDFPAAVDRIPGKG